MLPQLIKRPGAPLHPRMRAWAAAIGFVCAVAALAPSWLAGQDGSSSGSTIAGERLAVRLHTLDNGLRMLVLERRQAPTAALVVHYSVGSVHERLGNTGIAHVVEHMLFKGSHDIGTRDPAGERPLLTAADLARDSMIDEMARPLADTLRIQRLRQRGLELERQAHRLYAVPNEFDQILSAQGARGLNATTAHEATRYFVELPSNRVELWFALEADRMQNPAFRGFQTEMEVVREERRTRIETSPDGMLRVALLSTAFQVHPYGVPVIGHAADLETLTRRQAIEYHRSHYGARNAVVAVVGDVDTDQVLGWAERYFGGLVPGERTAPVTAREPRQMGSRRVNVEFDAQPRLLIGWPTVRGTHPDAPALSALASVLAGGRTTRLYRRLLLENSSAVSVTASLGPGFMYPRLFMVGATPRAPHTPAEIEEAIYDEIEALKQAPPQARELRRIQNQLRAGAYRRLSSNLDLAMQLAQSEATFGDWRETFRLDERLGEVTPQDIQRVAATYLIHRTRTVATLTQRSSP